MKNLNEKELLNTNGGRKVPPTINVTVKIASKYIRNHAGDRLNKPGWRIPGQ